MTFKTRRIVFYSLFFIFIVTGLGTIFYSQGWRINIEKCQIAKFWNCQIEFQKTGAIFIETKPKDVLIKIDGKTFKDKSGLIQSGTLITNLLPETYKVTIEKEGYLPWQKDLKVEPTLVAEILKTVLIPKKLEEKTISIPKTVDNFWINSQQKIIFKNNEIFYYLEKSSPFKLRGDKFIEWSSDGNKVILLDSKTQTYYLYEFNNLLKVLNINVVFNNLQKDTIDKIFFHPNQSDKLIIKSKNNLYLLDLARLKLEIFLEEPIIAWAINNPNIYYIKEIQNLTPAPQNVGTSTKNVLGTKKYFLASFNLVLKTESLISQLPNNLISSELKEELQISISGDKIAILSSAGSLYIFNQKDNTFKQIAHSAKKFIFSPDRKKNRFS